ncbi:DUF6318 family protein [Arthrobacter sp. B6]|uniref:DUF6318 family protein n=1 Tax=Arthrobacter sp. B6 TaxID=1570137 RepID=UPI0018D3ED97|nr:DUF6318 family protein [Arthrobacter sp. B6]
MGSDPNSGGTPSPSVSKTESATPSATPTPSPTAVYRPADASGPAQNVPIPVLPDVAKTETKEGALAFGSFFFSVLSYAYETGDLTLLENVAPKTCAPCQKSSEAIRAWHSEGRWLAGGKLTTPTVETTFSKDNEAKYKVAVQVHQEPLSYFRADGTLARTDPQAADSGNLLVVSFQNNSWVLHEVGSIVG